MKKWICALIFLSSIYAFGQRTTGNITASGSDCNTSSACVVQHLPSGSGAAAITLAGTFSATLQFEASGTKDDGTTAANYQAISCVPTNSTTTVTSATATGTWTCNVAGLTDIRVRASSYSSGTVAVTINNSPAAASSRFGASAPVGSFNVLPSVVSNGAQVVVGAGTTINVTPPASIVNGNLLIAIIEFDGVTGITMSAPAGWTQIATGGSTVAGCSSACVGLGSITNGKTIQWVFSKIAASESGNYTFTASASGESIFFGVITQLAGTATAEAVGTNTGNVTNLTVSGFATASANDLLLIMGHQNGGSAGVAQITTPAAMTSQVSGNQQIIATLPNGAGNTPSIKITWAQTGGAPATTQDSVLVVLAFAPSGTSTITPFVANSSSGSATLGSEHVIGPAVFDGSVSINQMAIPNGAGCTHSSPAIFGQTASGYGENILCLSSAGNLILDVEEHLTFVSTGGGVRGGPAFLVSSGLIDWVSQDASQDLNFLTGDSSNNLIIGCSTASCSGGTQQNDIIINAQTGKTVRIRNNFADVFTLSGAGITSIAGITTVGPGVPGIVYNTASASVNANITATTMVTAPATNANCPSGLTANCSVYELSWYIDVSAIGTSCAGATTVVFNVLYTDPLGAGQQTVASSTITVAATNGVAGTIVANGNQVLIAKLGTTVQYSTTSFTAGGSCSPAPKYQVTPILKQIS